MREYISQPQLGEECIRFRAECGLEVHCIPKRFSTTYAALGVRFGSFDTYFRDDTGECEVPFGTAHFLEHKMFDLPGGMDAFDLFATVGAQANAFTTNEYTAYVFSCTSEYEKALEHLLHFVATPHFTTETVRKERGIIEQEISSYEDDAQCKSYMLLLASMYKTHPIIHDIAGTPKSIQKITPTLLKRVYKHFYRPDNMVLTVAGRVSPDVVESIVDRVFGTTSRGENSIGRVLPAYDPDHLGTRTDTVMDITRPHLTIGYKNRYLAQDMTKQGYILDIAAACLFGRTSPLYRELFMRGLVSRDFDGYYEWSWGTGHFVISCDTDSVEETSRYIGQYLGAIAEHMPSREDFEEMRAVIYADTVSVFDTCSDIALSDLEESLCGSDFYSLPGMLKEISYSDFCHNILQQFCGNHPFEVITKPSVEGRSKRLI